MSERICDCKYCHCTVPASAVELDGKVYCCEACASAHPDRAPCQSSECDCHQHGWGGIKT
ncbi:metallothionein [Kushneria phosphatilytica]|uniref:Metallothionein n=1 Tax=Kushneria phosphatilytica TaxID=657387 RepID=A0A5C0ZXG0_9GAMM|nr:metallothionein [Kushneria phosphatilytica]QEL10678.1 metallothionein [Kushneria phosphatilytica]